MSNSTAILAALNAPAFDAVRDQIRANTLAFAARSLKKQKEALAAWVSENDYSKDRKTYPILRLAHNWVTKGRTEMVIANGSYFSARKALDLLATINEAEVIKAADLEWEETKQFYAARVGEKADLIGGDAEVTLSVGLDIELVGSCTVRLGAKVLVLATSLKTNYRYGENSANGYLTIYRQVPTVIISAEGFDPVATEVANEAAALAAKQDKKAELRRLGEVVDQAERRKRLWNDIYSTLTFANTCTGGILVNGNLSDVQENWAELGNAGKPLPTLAEAKLALKSAREAYKAAKQALKDAK